MITLGNRIASQSSKAPYSVQIEYLEVTNTDIGPYIDTLIDSTQINGFEIGICFRSGATLMWDGFGQKNPYHFMYQTMVEAAYRNAFRFRIFINDEERTSHIYVNSNIKNDIVIKNGLIVHDGVQMATYTDTGTFSTSAEHHWLFRNYARCTTGIVWYCKIYGNDGMTLLRDLIPVRKGTEGFMYDKVSNQLFGNSGTGSFILGPDVDESRIRV